MAGERTCSLSPLTVVCGLRQLVSRGRGHQPVDCRSRDGPEKNPPPLGRWGGLRSGCSWKDGRISEKKQISCFSFHVFFSYVLPCFLFHYFFGVCNLNSPEQKGGPPFSPCLDVRLLRSFEDSGVGMPKGQCAYLSYTASIDS